MAGLFAFLQQQQYDLLQQLKTTLRFSSVQSYHNSQSTMKLLVSITALLFASTASAFAPASVVVPNRNNAVAINMASAASEDFYIDDQRRLVMNLLMVGAGGLTVVGFGLPFILFFFPPGAGGGSGGTPAKDALGNDILAKEYLAAKPANDRSLAQGLKGDAT